VGGTRRAREAAEAELLALAVFRGRSQRRTVRVWSEALAKARELPRKDLPEVSPAHDGPPPPNRWSDRDPDAAARLAASRAALTVISERLHVPVENLLLPDLVRRTCWEPPAELTVESVAEVLRAGNARPWQVELTAEPLSVALGTAAPSRDAEDKPPLVTGE
jgi:ribonuclease D